MANKTIINRFSYVLSLTYPTIIMQTSELEILQILSNQELNSITAVTDSLYRLAWF